MTEMKTALGIAAAAAIAMAAIPAAHAAGVSKKEIVLGTHSDLSGVAAVWGVAAVNAMRMRFDQVNEDGGIYGRKIRFVVEDNQYQVPRAVQAANKLLNRDKVFAMVGALGTPMNNAVLKRQLAKNVPNLFPFSGARQMYEPHHKLKFQSMSAYYDQIRSAAKMWAEVKGKKKFCSMYQDTDFGREIQLAVEDQAKASGAQIVATSAHRPTDQDFVAAVSKLKAADCDVVFMGTIVRDTIIPYATARKLKWGTDFVGSIATYDTFVAGAKGGITTGYMAMTSFQLAYPDDKSPLVRNWIKAYKDKFGKDPNQASQLGYVAADLTVHALQKAGKDLTVDNLVTAIEGMTAYSDIFGGPVLSFGPDRHKGSGSSFLSMVDNGRWKKQSGVLAY